MSLVEGWRGWEGLEARERLVVALDFVSGGEALQLVERLDGQCRWFKVGMELFYAEGGGRGVVDALRGLGYEVFLDLKLHDIPNTVAGAVRSLEATGASLLTVHAGGGEAMMRAARDAVRGQALRLLAVTVLTSMDAGQMRGVGVRDEPMEQVLRLGRMAAGAGMDGMVCSAEEVGSLRGEVGDGPLLVVPGIRPAGAELGDQRRVAGPGEALGRGASMLVVGRPITQAPDPGAAMAAILDEMQREINGVI